MIFKLKMFFQRLFRGYSDMDVWNLDYTFAKWILPRLKYHRKHSIARLGGLSDEGTYIVQDKMIEGFELLAKYDEIEEEYIKSYYANKDRKERLEEWRKIDKAINEAFELFGKYGRHLGW